ncbi:uncharacterized protein [Rutidosis leptorrhynchoides]|uniref:uncharacterized protein n=1 Tax=Rutidosis leptorrhynchoides TaxID=125765 RepID=UPI003A9A34F2
MNNTNNHPALTMSNIRNHVPITLEMKKGQYSSWAELFKIHCRAHQVLDHIITSPTKPTTPKTIDTELWSRLDAIVLQWIFGTISIDLLHIILKPDTTAKYAWEALANIFQDNKNSRPDNRFSETRLDNVSHMSCYCKEIKMLGDQLAKEIQSQCCSGKNKNCEFSRNLSNEGFCTKPEDATTSSFEMPNPRDQGRPTFVQQPIKLEKLNVASPTETQTNVATVSSPKVNEKEKMWHYKDLSDKIQGPFSMAQLREWYKNGYFPVGIKIWRNGDKEDDAILLRDALKGKFTVVESRTVSQDGLKLTRDSNKISSMNPAPNRRRDIANLHPPPTPKKADVGLAGGQMGPSSHPSGKDGVQSATPNSVHLVASGNQEGYTAGSGCVRLHPKRSMILISNGRVEIFHSLGAQH